MRERSIPTAWLARCATEDEREAFRSQLAGSRKVFDELAYLLDREEKVISRGEIDYSDASWAYKMAHFNGMREMLNRIRQLIP